MCPAGLPALQCHVCLFVKNVDNPLVSSGVLVSQWAEHPACVTEVVGSNPTGDFFVLSPRCQKTGLLSLPQEHHMVASISTPELFSWVDPRLW